MVTQNGKGFLLSCMLLGSFVPLLVDGLTVKLDSTQPDFCFSVAKEAGVPLTPGGPPVPVSKTLEMHYDISGQGADEVELKVWRMSQTAREQIHIEDGRTDGYFEADFLSEMDSIFICFVSQDYEDKDLNFAIK